jgi:ribosome-binding protein aMBF1 (putative translation factor)
MNIIKKRKEKNKMDTHTLEEIKTKYYGETGTPERTRIDNELEALRIGVQIRNARESKKMTQAELAKRIDKKRTFISKIENDGGNITIKTLYDIVEHGLGGKLNIDVSL